MNSYILGIDLGVTSVGWGIIDKNGNIVDAGVRLFEEGNPAENATRREKRSGRRIKRRRKQRLIDLRSLLLRYGYNDSDFELLQNPYQIRVKGLNEKLSNQEFVTALMHIAKRRGSSLDIADFDESKEDAVSKQALLNNQKTLQENNLHVCELQLKRLIETGNIRGEQNIFKVEDYVKEVDAICTNQRIPSELTSKIKEIITRKRHYSEGPGSETSPTPYGRYRMIDGKVTYVNLLESMRGKCTIYPDELRAPLKSWSSELHNFLNDLNNIKIIDSSANYVNELGKITHDGKMAIVNQIKAQGYLKPKTNPAKGLADFLGTHIDYIEGLREKNGKPDITFFKGYSDIHALFKKHNEKIDYLPEIVDKVTNVLTTYKLKEERVSEIKKLELINHDELINEISLLGGFERFHRFSFKALNFLNDEMMNSHKNQMQIITDYNLLSNKEAASKLVIDDNAILSPVARRVQREGLKVIESLQDEYGYFDRIVVETTRSKNSQEEKREIDKFQRKREKENAEINELIEKHAEVTSKHKGQTALKLKLYKEQEGKCAYTYSSLDINAIIHQRDNYEIDHIIPYSISFDNSLHNKVLSLRAANQRKGNKTPFQYFMGGESFGPVTSYEKYKQLVLANSNYSKRKKELLTREDDVSKYIKEDFIARNLVDTSYGIRTFMTALKNHYKANNIPTTVLTMKGKVTNMFRGIGKAQIYKEFNLQDENPLEKDRDKFIHHAIDALIIAKLSEQAVFKEAYKIHNSERTDADTGEILHLKQPDEDGSLIRFLKNLGQLDPSDIRYSWKIDTKPNRKFSDETIYSTRTLDDKEYIVKKHKDIYSMTSSDIEKKLFSDKKKPSILMYKHDPKSFELLEKAYEQYKQEKYPFAAYKEAHGPIRKYAKNNQGAEIKNIKYVENKLGSHVDISHKYDVDDKKVVLLQISPYRTDFYQNADGTYKFVTIKYADLKPVDGEYTIDKEWYEAQKIQNNIEKNSKYLFSFHRNEIIELTKEGEKPQKYRFIATNNDINSIIEVKMIDQLTSKRFMLTIGKKMINIRKYSTDSIGKMYEIKNEVLKLSV